MTWMEFECGTALTTETHQYFLYFFDVEFSRFIKSWNRAQALFRFFLNRAVGGWHSHSGCGESGHPARCLETVSGRFHRREFVPRQARRPPAPQARRSESLLWRTKMPVPLQSGPQDHRSRLILITDD